MDLLESLIARPGQTQEARLPPALAPHFVDVEERSARELYEYATALAAQVSFFDAAGGTVQAAGDWAPFFEGRGLPRDRDGATPPHLALLAAFLKLYRVPRCLMNGITARHLDFFYRRVLGFAPREARPDRAHLLIELKKGAGKVEIGPAHLFSAGKDAAGVEQLYAPVGKTVINRAKVESLLSVFVDPANGGTVRFAPRANSADGLGGALHGDEPKWSAFGNPALPPAPIGFAVAAPVLRMAEGRRTVRVALSLGGLVAGMTPDELEKRVECFVTGEKRWLGPYTPDVVPAGDGLAFSFVVPPEDAAVVDYDRDRHGYAFAAAAPIVQVLLKVDDKAGAGRYRDLLPIVVHAASVSVAVEGMTSLQLESDLGALDPKRAYMPFGPQPVAGSRFMIGCPEALSKKLTDLKLELDWLGLPAGGFADGYTNYSNPPNESDATASAIFSDAAGRGSSPTSHVIFPTDGSKLTLDLTTDARGATAAPRVEPLAVQRIRAFSLGGGRAIAEAVFRELQRTPVFGFARAAPAALRSGFITLTLNRDLGHAEYRSKILAHAGTLPSEPYTPTLRSLSLRYDASAGPVPVDSGSDSDFANAEVQFFHVGSFGQRREHGWLRAQLPFVDEKRVPLFPTYEDEGELLIGLSSLAAGDGVSLLFKVAEGSADPDVDAPPEVRWAVLCDNYWKPLAGEDSVRDGTDDLLATGIVDFTLPAEATTQNTYLPANLLWLKASARKDSRGVCALVGVAANAVEVRRVSAATPAARLWSPLPSGSIARLKTPVGAVKAVTQPYATFGGTNPETPQALDTRAAERLRHRARAITAWDYERLVLAAFPEVRKVKVVPHCAARGDWFDPGHVTVVVVPDLRLRNAVDPLQPRADADTLRRIREHLEERSAMGARDHAGPRAPGKIVLHVRNPRFQRIHLDFKVRFRPGVEFNYHARLLREALVDHLSPWRLDPGAAIAFGGTVYKSHLLDFVEDMPYVDYVTDFRMHDLRGGPRDAEDVEEARAETPDAILVSDATHDIAPVADAVAGAA